MIVSFEQVIEVILHNTVKELESRTLFALNKYLPNYTIGPLISVPKAKTTHESSASYGSNRECTNLLDSKPPGSVL